MTAALFVFYILCAVALAAWCTGVVYYFRAARAAQAGTPWSVRAQPLYLLTKPEVWTPDGRRYWKMYFACMVVFVASMAGMFLADRLL